MAWHRAGITLRELPPEISQRKLASIAGNTLNLRAHGRVLIQRALDKYKSKRKMKEYELAGSS